MSIGCERLRPGSLSGAVVFLFRFPACFVPRIIGLLDAGFGVCKELEHSVKVDPGKLDDGVFAVHELCEPDHSFGSGCSG